MGKLLRAVAIAMLLGAGGVLAFVVANLVEAGEALRPRPGYVIGGNLAWPISLPALLILVGLGSLGRNDRTAALAGALALASAGFFLLAQGAATGG